MSLNVSNYKIYILEYNLQRPTDNELWCSLIFPKGLLILASRKFSNDHIEYKNFKGYTNVFRKLSSDFDSDSVSMLLCWTHLCIDKLPEFDY